MSLFIDPLFYLFSYYSRSLVGMIVDSRAEFVLDHQNFIAIRWSINLGTKQYNVLNQHQLRFRMIFQNYSDISFSLCASFGWLFIMGT